MYGVEALVEDIQKELEEAKKYNYSDFVVKQDLINMVGEFERQTITDAYEDAREEFKEKWERSCADPYNYSFDKGAEEDEDD